VHDRGHLGESFHRIMIWVGLVIAAVSWLVVSLISQEQRGETVPFRVRLSRAVAAGTSVARGVPASVRDRVRHWWDRQTERRALRSGSRTFAPTDGGFGNHRTGAGRVRWRSRVVAAMQLILYVVLVSALVAGAMAAVALRVGHFHL